jgi:hypothetical protein
LTEQSCMRTPPWRIASRPAFGGRVGSASIRRHWAYVRSGENTNLRALEPRPIRAQSDGGFLVPESGPDQPTAHCCFADPSLLACARLAAISTETFHDHWPRGRFGLRADARAQGVSPLMNFRFRLWNSSPCRQQRCLGPAINTTNSLRRKWSRYSPFRRRCVYHR